MRRKGLGKGQGMGYKNLAPMDSHVHSLSAKGVKSIYKLNMMGLATIKALNEEKYQDAKKKNTQPTLIKSQSQIDNMPPFPFKHIGDYVPKGWEKTNEYFVDSSGFGDEGEPALTIQQFKDRMKVGYGYAISEAGQFQVYIKEFKKTGESTRRRGAPPRYTNYQIGDAFKRGETSGVANSMEIVDRPNETLLVGYGWAVYGSRNKDTGRITFFSGWDGYSPTTSKQLSQTGLRGADRTVPLKREL